MELLTCASSNSQESFDRYFCPKFWREHMSDEGYNFEYGDLSSQSDTTDSAAVFGTQLREVLDGIDVSNSLTTPLRAAIEQILQLAAEAVGSETASVLVRDGN